LPGMSKKGIKAQGKDQRRRGDSPIRSLDLIVVKKQGGGIALLPLAKRAGGVIKKRNTE